MTNALGELIYELYREHATRQKKDKYWRFAFYDYPLLLKIQDDLMPRAKKAHLNASQPKSTTVQITSSWVNLRLSEEEIQEVLHLSQQPDEIGKALASVLINGYGFSVRANADKNNFSAFITNIPSSQPDTLYSISGFAPSPLGAAASVIVKMDIFIRDPQRALLSGQTLGIG